MYNYYNKNILSYVFNYSHWFNFYVYFKDTSQG